MDDYTDRSATFGDRLALAREMQGMSQAQLARRLGLKTATIQNWEEDRSEPRANRVQMLAGFLNISIIWLMTGEGTGGPGPADASAGKVTLAMVDELRDLRLMHLQMAERMSRLEKRLRERQEGS
ncbi:MAG: helix-turn-helix transcriptional regulator [Pseudomonadota bacterium]